MSQTQLKPHPLKISVAVDLNNAIGWSDGRLPFHHPDDMALFKRRTVNQSVIMGRKTWDSLPPHQRPLPHRTSFVITRGSDIPGAVTCNSLEHAIECAKTKKSEIWLIGGAQIYNEAIHKGLVDEIHLTIFKLHTQADVTLDVDLARWGLFIERAKNEGQMWQPGDFSTIPSVDRRTDDYCTFVSLYKQ
jgi:dihydrofolate reductase